MYLIEQDVLSVADADAAVSWGPGLRWGIMGPNLQFHLAGGAGGMKHFFEGVFDGLSPLFNTLGNPKITPELKQTIAEGVLQEAGGRTVEQLAQGRKRVADWAASSACKLTFRRSPAQFPGIFQRAGRGATVARRSSGPGRAGE